MSLFDFFWAKLVEKLGEGDAVAFAVAFAVVVAVAFASTFAVIFTFTSAFAVAFAVAVAFASTFTSTFAFAVISTGILFYFGIINSPPAILFIIAVLVLTELFFWTSKIKPNKKQSVFWFTARRKATYLAESTFLVIEANGAYYATKVGAEWMGLNQKIINQLVCFFGWGTTIIAITGAVEYIWIRLNMKKYAKVKK